MANDEAMVELARGLALRLLNEVKSSDEARIQRAFKLCLSRQPDARESKVVLNYLRQQTEEFSADAASASKASGPELPDGVVPAEAAAWTALSRALINLDEFITRE
jgi:hypothetical protein